MLVLETVLEISGRTYSKDISEKISVSCRATRKCCRSNSVNIKHHLPLCSWHRDAGIDKPGGKHGLACLSAKAREDSNRQQYPIQETTSHPEVPSTSRHKGCKALHETARATILDMSARSSRFITKDCAGGDENRVFT